MIYTLTIASTGMRRSQFKIETESKIRVETTGSVIILSTAEKGLIVALPIKGFLTLDLDGELELFEPDDE